MIGLLVLALLGYGTYSLVACAGAGWSGSGSTPALGAVAAGAVLALFFADPVLLVLAALAGSAAGAARRTTGPSQALLLAVSVILAAGALLLSL